MPAPEPEEMSTVKEEIDTGTLGRFDGSIKDEKASNACPGRIEVAYHRLGKGGIFTHMATPGTPLSFSDVLRLRPVRRLWIAQIVSVFGDFLAVFAIIAVVTFELHGTATQVAMVLVSFMALLAIGRRRDAIFDGVQTCALPI